MGYVDVPPDRLLDFCGPILGFEAYRRFALVPSPEAAPLHWLQCIDEPQLAFPIVAAEEIGMAYRPGRELMAKVRARQWDHIECWVLLAFSPEASGVRVNLRAPILVNSVTRRAAQVIVRDELPISGAIESCAEAALCAAAV
jgi:flagellar assembly factor FliW